jgi:hypothetical protein
LICLAIRLVLGSEFLADLLLEMLTILEKGAAGIGEESLFCVRQRIYLFLLLVGGHRLNVAILKGTEFGELEFLCSQNSGHIIPYAETLTADLKFFLLILFLSLRLIFLRIFIFAVSWRSFIPGPIVHEGLSVTIGIPCVGESHA